MNACPAHEWCENDHSDYPGKHPLEAITHWRTVEHHGVEVELKVDEDGPQVVWFPHFTDALSPDDLGRIIDALTEVRSDLATFTAGLGSRD